MTEPKAKKIKTGSDSEPASGSQDDNRPLGIYYTKVSGIHDSFNNEVTKSLKEILSDGNLVESAQFNYMFEVDWLISQYPSDYQTLPLTIVHQNKPDTNAYLVQDTKVYPQIKLIRAPLPDAYGTHHTKMMFLRYTDGFRVVIHTANLIERDWYAKTQGGWMSPVFPFAKNGTDSTTFFQRDLIEYLNGYRCSGLKYWIDLIKTTDMSEANVFIIGSIPSRQKASPSFGHLKLRHVLASHANLATNAWPIVGQFSSIGSLGPSADKWLTGELLASLKSTKQKSFASETSLKLIFPSEDDVMDSLEGEAAGGSIPYSKATEERQPYLRKFFNRWKSDLRGRTRAAPHIKTYARFSPNSQQLAWFLITSANLSKAAWGCFEKKQTQLFIRSYELGVLFLPKFFVS